MKKIALFVLVVVTGNFFGTKVFAVTADNVMCTVRCIGSAEIDLNAITSSLIADGSITNADINSSAGITSDKLADGSGSLLDADFFDGLNFTQFLRSDQNGSVNGKVGIGTSAAAGKTLDVEGDVAISSSGLGFAINNDANGTHFWTNNSYSRSTPTSGWTNTVTLKNGFVGIGTSATPGKTLDVEGDLAIDNLGQALAISTDSSGAHFWTNSAYNRSTPTSGWNSLMNFKSGKVGIGTSSPSYSLDVNGTINATEFCLAGDCSFGESTTSATNIAYPDPTLSDQGSSSTSGTIAYYLNAMSTTGGIIYLQAGTYSTSTPLELQSNVSIIGSGKSSLITLTSSADKRILRNPGAVEGTDGATVHDVTLGNFAISGHPGDHKDCIVFDASSSSENENINLYSLNVQNCGGNGILIGDSKKVQLSNIYLANNGTNSIDISYPDHNIYLRSVQDVILDNILSTTAISDGIHIADAEKVSVGNVVSWNNSGRGIFLGGVFETTITNAVVYGNDDFGIELGGDDSSSTPNSENITISGCNVAKNNQDLHRSLSAPAGIYSRDTHGLTISGCSIQENTYGVVLASGTQDAIIDGNNLKNNTTASYYDGSGDPDILKGDNLE